MQTVFHQFQGETLEDYYPHNESQKEAKDALTEYLSDLNHRRETGRGLTIVGPSGVGKTKLGCIVLNRAAEDGYRIEAIEMSTYIELIQRRFHLTEMVKHSDSDDALLDQWMGTDKHLRQLSGWKKGPDWVLFDDVGREHESESGWSNHQLHDVLRFRFDRGLPFIVTTNVPLSDVEERYGEAMTSVLYEATTVMVIVGDDYRKDMHRIRTASWNGDS